MSLKDDQARLLIELARQTADAPIRPQPQNEVPVPGSTKMQWRDVVVAELRRRDGNTCYICHGDLGLNTPHIDHIVPLSCGGDHLLHNLALTHDDCNSKKGPLIIAFGASDRRPRYYHGRRSPQC